MKYGQLVVGPAGSGKSTYCKAIQDHCKNVGRSVFIVNLDPAADTFAYECTADIRELISVDDVLEDKEMAMGPNGALIFCMEYLAKNLEWLQEQVDEGEDAYFLFDCPGQIELYSHLSVMPQIVQALQEWNFSVCSTFILDTMFCLDPDKFISASLTALSTLTLLTAPAVNVLSKMDLLTEEERQSIQELLDGDLHQNLLQKANTSWGEKHRKLTEAIASVVADHNLVRYYSLDIEDEDSIEELLMAIDSTIQFGEDADVKDRYPAEEDPADCQ